MKINFKKFNIPKNITKTAFIETDISTDIANAVYTQVQGIAALDLAMRIYKAEGEVELNANETDVIGKLILQIYPPRIIEAWREAIALAKTSE